MSSLSFVFNTNEYSVFALWYLMQLDPLFSTPAFLHQMLYYAILYCNPATVHYLLREPQVDPSQVDITHVFHNAPNRPDTFNRRLMVAESLRRDGRGGVVPDHFASPEGAADHHTLLMALVRQYFGMARRLLRYINPVEMMMDGHAFQYFVVTGNYEAILLLMRDNRVDITTHLARMDPMIRYDVVHNLVRREFGVVRSYFRENSRFSRLAPDEQRLVRQHVHVRELVHRRVPPEVLHVMDNHIPLWRRTL